MCAPDFSRSTLRRACGSLDNKTVPSWAQYRAPKMGVAQNCVSTFRGGRPARCVNICFAVPISTTAEFLRMFGRIQKFFSKGVCYLFDRIFL